jgi:hypothetical protein
VLLVLTHLHTDLALLGLRVGARIVVYNAHRIRSPLGGGGGSGGLPGGGGSGGLPGGGWAVGACGTTSFEIVRFSPWDTPSWPRYGTACGSCPLPTAASTFMYASASSAAGRMPSCGSWIMRRRENPKP